MNKLLRPSSARQVHAADTVARYSSARQVHATDTVARQIVSVRHRGDPKYSQNILKIFHSAVL